MSNTKILKLKRHPLGRVPLGLERRKAYGCHFGSQAYPSGA